MELFQSFKLLVQNMLISSDMLFFIAFVILTIVAMPSGIGMYRARKRLQSLYREVDSRDKQIEQLEAALITSQDALVRLEGIEQAHVDIRAQLAVKTRDAQEYAGSNTELKSELAAFSAKYYALRTELTVAKERLASERAALNEKIEVIQQSRQQLSSEFELLANKIFEEKQLRFNKQSEKQLVATLDPFKNQLSEFRKRVDDIYSTESKERHLLKQQINDLREQSYRISEDANTLSNALRFDNKVQGNWGELTLIRALEMCGLTEPAEYETQVSLQAEDNARQVPDVIVHLPGGRDIIIDSKVSLLAYARYFEAEDEAAQSAAIADHLQSIRQHVKQLSAKAYQQIPGLQTLDYVMLYIPVEGASALALQSHRGLWEEAYAKNIVLVSPTNLLAILRSVETIWRHEKQNKNAEEIARQAGNLHDKFVGLTKTLEEVGRGIEMTQRAYDKAFGQLSQGRGNLVARVKSLETLGAKTRRSIAEHMLQSSESSNEMLEIEDKSTEAVE